MIVIDQKMPTSIHVGNINVVRVMVGYIQVYPTTTTEVPYLNVSPSNVLLNTSNSNSNNVTIKSNTSWTIEEI